MNPVEKGDILENNAVGIINKMIDDKILPLDRQFLKIFAKKKYPSIIRKGGIVFDLTIEVWPPNADRYSMIYIFECKNYNKRIPLSEVKKFYDDVIETQGINAKGIMICSSPLQKGALEFAEARKMMVIEGESNEDYKITLYRRSKPQENRIPIIIDTLSEGSLDEGIKIYEKLIDCVVLDSLVKSKSNVSFGVDSLSKIDITKIAIDELNKLDSAYLNKGYGLNVNTVINYIEKEYDLKVVKIAPTDKNYLGTCNIEERTIGLSKSIINTPRELFVLCHEIGHYILHQKLMINQIVLESFSDSEMNLKTGRHSLENAYHWIEWQANYFSASFILPQSSLMAMLWKSQLRRNLQKGNLYIDDQRVNQRTFYSIVEFLSNYFNVSKTSIIYRLKEFNLIEDNSRAKSIGELIKEYKENIFT